MKPALFEIPARGRLLPLLLIFCTAPAYASPETFLDGMRRGGFDRLSDEQVLNLGRWACDRNPDQAFDDAFAVFDRQGIEYSRAEILALNLSQLSYYELCPIVRLDSVHVVVQENAVFRDNSSIYGTPLFSAANQIYGTSTLRTGNWVNVRVSDTNGRERRGWVHVSQLRFEDD
jgi:hypothetical protein